MADDNDRQDTTRLEVEQLDRMRAKLKLLEVEKGFTKEAREILQKNLDLQSQIVQVKREEVAYITKAMVDLERLEEGSIERQKVINKLKAMNLKADKESLVEAINKLKESEKVLEIQKDSNTAADKLLRSTLGISDGWKGTATGALATSVAVLATKGGAKTLWTSIRGTATAANILMSTLSKIVEMSVLTAKQYDKSAASIRQVAGAESGLEQQAYDASRANLQLGIGIGEASEATLALHRNMAGFSLASKENTELLGLQAAILKEVGVGLEVSGQMFNVLDKGLGMSAPEIKDYTAKLYDMSEQLKVPPDVIFKDWQAASKELMKYGDGMVDVLEGLEHQSKNTGLAVGDLLGIAKQFDQFDTAGEAVGRLNAILGGPYLNAIDMVYMTEDERIEALRETISLSGQVWKDMGRHEQQAIAAAAGISDMAQAAQLFGGTQTEFTDAAANQEALAERAKQAQSAMDNIARAMEGIAVAVKPLIDKVILPLSRGLAAIAATTLGGWGMTAAAAMLFFLGVGMKVLSWKAANLAADKAQELLELQLDAARRTSLATQQAGNASEAESILFKEGSILRTKKNIIATEGESAAKVKNKVATDLGAASEEKAIVVKKASTLSSWQLAKATMAVLAAVALMVIGFMFFDNLLGGLSPGMRIFVGGLLAIAAAIALVVAYSTLGVGLPFLVAAGASVGVMVAGMKGVVTGAQEFHDGGRVPGIRGENKQATLAAGETVLPTHKKSDDQAVADAEAKGQLSLTKDKGFEEVTQAINNLVAKLNTMITQSEERAKGGGKEKAVEVTMELDRDKVGEATASWLEEKYGWTGA